MQASPHRPCWPGDLSDGDFLSTPPVTAAESPSERVHPKSELFVSAFTDQAMSSSADRWTAQWLGFLSELFCALGCGGFCPSRSVNQDQALGARSLALQNVLLHPCVWLVVGAVWAEFCLRSSPAEDLCRTHRSSPSWHVVFCPRVARLCRGLAGLGFSSELDVPLQLLIGLHYQVHFADLQHHRSFQPSPVDGRQWCRRTCKELMVLRGPVFMS